MRRGLGVACAEKLGVPTASIANAVQAIMYLLLECSKLDVRALSLSLSHTHRNISLSLTHPLLSLNPSLSLNTTPPLSLS